MMDGGVSDVADLLADGVGDGGYSLAQVDVDHVMQFLWFLSAVELVQLVALLLVAGLLFSQILTRKWA